LAMASVASQATPIVYTYDFIPDSTRSGFNGFENAAVDGWFFNGTFPYSEGGISVSQVADNPRSIWMTAGAIGAPGYSFGVTGHEGQYSWYPNGGDDGFTKLTLSNGIDFESVGFLTGNAYTSVGSTYLKYVLWDNGETVLTGQVLIPKGSPDRGYLGFGGGGFDEIWVSEVSVTGGNNALALDSIETVPEPTTISLLGVALLGLAVGRRRIGVNGLRNYT